MFVNETIQWSPGVTLEMIEKQVVLKAFQFFRGRKTETANALGISIRTLEAKLNEYKTDDEVWKVKEKNAAAQRELFLARQRGAKTPNYIEGFEPNGPSSEAVGDSAVAGVRMESIANASAQSDMPMPKRAQVQDMLPKPLATSGPKKGR